MSAGRLTTAEIVDVSRRFLASDLVVRLVPTRPAAGHRTGRTSSCGASRTLSWPVSTPSPGATSPPSRPWWSTPPSPPRPRRWATTRSRRCGCRVVPGRRCGPWSPPPATAKPPLSTPRPRPPASPGGRWWPWRHPQGGGRAALRGPRRPHHRPLRLRLEDEPLAAGSVVIVDETPHVATRDAAVIVRAVAAHDLERDDRSYRSVARGSSRRTGTRAGWLRRVELPDGSNHHGNVKVGPATARDVAGISFVHVDSWRFTYRGLVPNEFLEGLSVEQRVPVWTALVADETSTSALLVLEDATEVIGFSHFGPSRDEDADGATGEVTSIYLLKSSWRRGGGTLLLDSITTAMRGSQVLEGGLVGARPERTGPPLLRAPRLGLRWWRKDRGFRNFPTP